MPQSKEQWIVKINRQEFIINGEEKVKLEDAMQRKVKWFKTNKGDILSVNHIESVVLSSREIENQLEPSYNVDNNVLSREEARKRLAEMRKSFPVKLPPRS